MEIKKDAKFKKLFKRFGALSLACVLCIAIALTLALCLPKEKVEEVGTTPISFELPMKNAVITKDFADDRLQYNDSLERWEIHLAVDLISENDEVMAICDGIVDVVNDNSLEGNFIEITHENGFKSVYSSLDDGINLKKGDKVEKGQVIGKTSNSAGNEVVSGGHLHFTLFKDGLEVDPNLYLDLQVK